ncbi:MAG: hypothetical protein KAT14_04105, partial [Candidatus Marinimicrobia bacterium]|nr:hypothetical protein [Candidatus Neomarinimicrobiota bacterium]
RLWNMGNGMLLVVNPDHAGDIVRFAQTRKYEAKICGKIIKKPEIVIDTKGLDPKRLTYKAIL